MQALEVIEEPGAYSHGQNNLNYSPFFHNICPHPSVHKDQGSIKLKRDLMRNDHPYSSHWQNNLNYSPFFTIFVHIPPCAKTKEALNSRET